MLIGTYTGTGSRGIYSASFDPLTGKLGEPTVAAETESPSFVIRDFTNKHAYAVNESSGKVSAFSIATGGGKLVKLNQVDTHGKGPCHLAIDRAGKILVVANYSSGSIASYPVHKDGSLGEAAYTETFKSPLGTDKKRQEQSHAHSTTFTSGDSLLLVNDLGGDSTHVYRVDAEKGKLTSVWIAPATAGSGPRHLAIAKSGRAVYVVNELASSISVRSWDPKLKLMKELQSISTLPVDFHGENTDAEIAIGGNYVYASNRGHDTIAVFSIDTKSGKLTHVQTIGSGGKTPRSFAIDGSGKWLLAANQESNNVVVFSIDQKTGKLTQTEFRIKVPAAVCVNFSAIR